MSEADKMFEELGYKKEFYIRKNGEKYGEYHINKYNEVISFDYEGKQVCCHETCAEGDSIYFNMGELQAINQKCKELRWI